MAEKILVTQRDFSGGQLNPNAARRDDSPIVKAGLKTGRNIRLLTTGSASQRPGRRVRFTTDGYTFRVTPTFGVSWDITLDHQSIRVRPNGGGVGLTRQILTGLPWTLDNVFEVRAQLVGAQVILTHQSFRPVVVTYTDGTWAWAYLQFAVNANNSSREPFYNFQTGKGITMNMSARSGTGLTMTFSAPTLSAKHVGVKFRYAGRQVTVTQVSSATQAIVDAAEELPPSYDVVLSNVDGLEVSDFISGLTSNTKGQVTAINKATKTATVIASNNWSGFVTSEVFVGPRCRATVSSQTQLTNPTATLNWDEAFLSDFRGWPGSVGYDAQRIIFCNFKQYGSAVLWGATGTITDFDIGSDATDAILEFVPENCQVYDVIGGSDEFIFTDKKIYYVPVSEGRPVAPGSIQFREIATDAAAPVRPAPTAEGVVYVNAGRTRILAIIGTGQTAKPYLVDDLTDLAAGEGGVLSSPVCIASTSTNTSSPERYLYAVNSDGTIAVARYARQAQWTGWVVWDGAGKAKWISDAGTEMILTSEYKLAGQTVKFSEVLDDDALIDAEITIFAGMDYSQPIVLSSGMDAEDIRFPPGTENLSLVKDGWHRGFYDLRNDATFSGVIPISSAIEAKIGFSFTVEMEPFIPQATEGQYRGQRTRKRRIVKLAATFRTTQTVKVAGRLVPFWNTGENEEQPPPLRNTTYTTRPLGREYDPSWSIVRDLPGHLVVLEMSTAVTV